MKKTKIGRRFVDVALQRLYGVDGTAVVRLPCLGKRGLEGWLGGALAF